MAPKKKGNKKGDDDWEADLGEIVDPIAAATQEAKDADAAQDEEGEAAGGGGGLLAALKKNKSKKQKKGKAVEEDYVEGEDIPGTNGVNGHTEPNGIEDLAAKAPEEATTDDLFAAPATKGKGGKGKQGKSEAAPKEDGDDLEEDKKRRKRRKRERSSGRRSRYAEHIMHT